MQVNQIVGKNIRKFREKLSLSQEELGVFLGVSRVELNYYENSNRNIPSAVISKCAKLFMIDEYDLYEENELVTQANVAFAFRAETLCAEDLNSIADFRKIVHNYLKMKKHCSL